MKSIHVYDLFYKVALDIVGPLLKTKDGNRYALVAIDHYSKWCEARLVKDHDATTTTRFLEEEIICRFGVPKFIFTDNGGEWMVEFDLMSKKYGIIH
jgi:transposase-like protein